MEALLADESKMQGTAEGLAQPRTEAELVEIMRESAKHSLPVTFSAGLTGITGGAVPKGGIAINFQKMNQITGMQYKDGVWFVRCQPGLTLSALRTALHARSFEGSETWGEADRKALSDFQAAAEQQFPVDPTEATAAIGGMVACNASGARSFHYGAMRNYVEGFRAVLADGRILSLHRGEAKAGQGRTFSLKLESGATVSGQLPAYAMPATKNAAGYFAADGMDLVDLFVGCEGTLCAFSEITLRLVTAPAQILGLICFLPGEAEALKLVRSLRGEAGLKLPVPPLAIEYFDCNTLNLLRSKRNDPAMAGKIPDLPESYHTAIYTEFAGSADQCDEAAMALAEALDSFGCADDATWMATTPAEHEKLKAFRHLVPETVNHRIGEIKRDCPGITKLGTDMAVPDNCLERIMALYRAKLAKAGFEYVIFGHIGNNHVHVNILPRSQAEYDVGKKLYKEFAQAAVEMGGSISAEHGVGKLKAFLIPVMFGESGVADMRSVKRAFDPQGRLNRGNVFEWR